MVLALSSWSQRSNLPNVNVVFPFFIIAWLSWEWNAGISKKIRENGYSLYAQYSIPICIQKALTVRQIWLGLGNWTPNNMRVPMESDQVKTSSKLAWDSEFFVTSSKIF